MTLSEFEMHRPKLYSSLSEFLANHWGEPGVDVKEWEIGEADIQPSYWDGCLFIAQFESLQKLVCLADEGWAWDGDL